MGFVCGCQCLLNSFYDKFVFTNALQYRNNNFFLVNLPFVILPVDVLSFIASKEDSNLNYSLYSAVKQAVIANMKKSFEVDFGLEGEKGLSFMEAYLSASGWGRIERTDLDFEKGRCLVSVTNSPIASNCNKARAPVDTLLRGLLAGLYSIYFNREVECLETRCSALGEQHCDFVIKTLEEFDFTNPLTRSQLRVE